MFDSSIFNGYWFILVFYLFSVNFKFKPLQNYPVHPHFHFYHRFKCTLFWYYSCVSSYIPMVLFVPSFCFVKPVFLEVYLFYSFSGNQLLVLLIISFPSIFYFNFWYNIYYFILSPFHGSTLLYFFRFEVKYLFIFLLLLGGR